MDHSIPNVSQMIKIRYNNPGKITEYFYTDNYFYGFLEQEN
jgi:hypothetical protein